MEAGADQLALMARRANRGTLVSEQPQTKKGGPPDMKTAVSQAIAAALPGAEKAISAAGAAVEGLPSFGDVATTATGAAKQAVGSASDLADNVTAKLAAAAADVVGGLPDLPGVPDEGAAQKAIGTARGFASGLAEHLKDSAADGAQGAADFPEFGSVAKTQAAVKTAVTKAKSAISDSFAKAEDISSSVLGHIRAAAKQLNITLPDHNASASSVKQLQTQIQDQVATFDRLAKGKMADASAKEQAQLNNATAELRKMAAEAMDAMQAAEDQAAEVVAGKLGADLRDMPQGARNTLEEAVGTVTVKGADKSTANGRPVSFLLVSAVLLATYMVA